MSHSHHEEGSTMLYRPLWALEAAYSIVRNTAVTHTLSDKEAASFDRSLQQESALPWVQAAIQATLPFGLYSPADSLILEAFAVRKETMWSLWQTSLGKLQHRSLGFSSKAMLSADNYILLIVPGMLLDPPDNGH